jgi:hypothetical protein
MWQTIDGLVRERNMEGMSDKEYGLATFRKNSPSNCKKKRQRGRLISH